MMCRKGSLQTSFFVEWASAKKTRHERIFVLAAMVTKHIFVLFEGDQNAAVPGVRRYRGLHMWDITNT